MRTLKEIIKKHLGHLGFTEDTLLESDLEELIEQAHKEGYIKGLRNEMGTHHILTAEESWQQNKERFLGK